MNQIRSNSLLATLNEAAENAIFNNLNRFSAERHTVLQRAGEPTGHVYFPSAGVVSFLTVMSDGEAVETAAVGFDYVRSQYCIKRAQLELPTYCTTRHARIPDSLTALPRGI